MGVSNKVAGEFILCMGGLIHSERCELKYVAGLHAIHWWLLHGCGCVLFGDVQCYFIYLAIF